MTRIAIYCGTPALTRGLEAVLRNHSMFEMLPPCRSLFSLMAVLAEGGPDLILLDHTAEVTSEVLREVTRRAPGARIVLWADKFSTEAAMEAMKAGVRGILRKTLPLDLQTKCLLKVQSGELWFERALADPIPAPARLHLTAEEAKLVSLLSQGLKNWEIADSLAIPESGVEQLLQRLFRKLGVKDRFELALFGLKNLAQRPGINGAKGGSIADEKNSGALGMPFAPMLQ